MSSSQLNTRRNLLTAAYNTYCRSVGCGVLPPDPTPLRLKKVESTFDRYAYVRCPPSYNLLSCGLANIRREGDYDLGRSAYPTNSEWCRCFSVGGGVCVAWCTSAMVSGFRTVWSPPRPALSRRGRSEFAAYCPSGYKVYYTDVDMLLIVSIYNRLSLDASPPLTTDTSSSLSI